VRKFSKRSPTVHQRFGAALLYTVATHRWDDTQDVIRRFVGQSAEAVSSGKIGQLPALAANFGRDLWWALRRYREEKQERAGIYVKDDPPGRISHGLCLC
jgi:hypothetical protein